MTGGAAMMMAGMPRPTGDIDVVIRRDSIEEAAARYRDAGATLEPVADERMVGFLATVPTEAGPVEVDVTYRVDEEGQEPGWMPEAMFSAQEGQLSRPWLMATKLLATREKDLEDSIAIWDTLPDNEKQRVRELVQELPWDARENLETVELMARLRQEEPEDAYAWARAWLKFACRKGLSPRNAGQ
jgi:hypothetical protein